MFELEDRSKISSYTDFLTLRGSQSRKRRKKWYHVLLNWAIKWCLLTPMDGWKYIAMPDQHWCERFLWAAEVVLMALLALYVLLAALKEFYASTTINAVDNFHFHIWNMPFPAVTICPLNIMMLSRVRIMANTLSANSAGGDSLDSATAESDLTLLGELLYPTLNEPTPTLRRLQKALDARSLQPHTVLEYLSPTCSEILKSCRWKERLTATCTSLFVSIVTEEGVCCTFNYRATHMKQSNSTREPGAPTETLLFDGGTRAFRVSGNSHHVGLSVILRDKLDEYTATLGASLGIKVLVHDAYELPNDAESSVVGPGREAFLGVVPQEVYSTPEVQALPLRKRSCRLREEAQTLKTRLHSFHNCFVECRARYMRSTCGCTPFYLPRFDGDRVCNLEDVPCLAKNKGLLLSLSNKTEVDTETLEADYRTDKVPCSCLPSCRIRKYTVQEASLPINFSGMTFTSRNFYRTLRPVNNSVLHVYFDDVSGLRYRLDILHTAIDLIGNVGGLTSLLIGVSLISVMELVYHWTLRPAVALMCRKPKIHQVSRPAHQYTITVKPGRRAFLMPHRRGWI